jgi:uncharacterized spore protein YtfJ
MNESEVEALKKNVGGLFSEGIVDRLFNSLGGNAQSSLMFGEAVQRGDTTVIPVARIVYGFGLGGGQGKGQRGSEERREGGGSGGGGGVIGEPVGYIEIRDGKGTRFVRTPVWGIREVSVLLATVAIPLIFLALSRREKTR